MPKTTVDQCLALRAGALMKLGFLAPNVRGNRGLKFNGPETGIERGRIGVYCQIGDDAGHIRLLHCVDGDGSPYITSAIGYDVIVVATRLAWGKLKWWFICPACEEREELTANLYLKPGAQRFACRRCHGLAYRSSQESRKMAVAG